MCECPGCGELIERFDKKCRHCGEQLIWDNGKPRLKNETEKAAEEIGQAAAIMAIGAVLLIGLPLLFKLLVWLGKILLIALGGLFKLIAFPVTILRKKPKIVVPIYIGIAICIVIALSWYNSAEQKYLRAEKYLNLPEKQQEGLSLLKDSSRKKYVPAMLMYADILFQGKYGEKVNPTGAFALVDNAAELGDGKAWYLKGECLESGRGIVRNLTEANACYHKAINAGYADAKQAVERTAEIAKHWNSANKGNAESQYHLGVCYETGKGISADDVSARQWFTKSANAGYAPAQVKLCSWMVAGKGGTQDSVLGFSYCEKAAKQNYPEAFTMLGEYYFEGKIVPRNYTKAVQNFSYAAKKGSASAAFKLGYCYRNGFGTPTDVKKSFRYFQLSAERKFAPAMYSLGECYENGIGVAVDYTKALASYADSAKSKWEESTIRKSEKDAVSAEKRLSEIGKWWSLANEKNDPQAQCNVGTCYFTGNGVKKDFNKALAWFQKSAEQNNLEGIVRVADCQFYGYGIKQDAEAAVDTYRKAAEKGQPYAMFRLGQCCETGTGIEQNLTRAYNWYQKASASKYTQAEKEAERIKEPGTVWDAAVKDNNAEAQFRLGGCYFFGDTGLPKDLKKAFEWYKKSSEQGFIKATHNLGICYLNGWGTEKNVELMKKCFFEAAKKDYPPSVCTVAELYQKGIGVEQNLTTAYRYYAKAATYQDKNAIEQLKRIKVIAKVWDPAHKGNAKAQHLLGHCYRTGNGIEKNAEKAEEWLLKSANQEYANAQYDLAEFYASRSKGDDNLQTIVSWISKAAEKGHIKAMVKLGEFYYSGRGVKEDYGKSVELWEKAVDANDTNALYLLGKHRFNGRGLFNSGKDVDKAVALWTKAAELGHPEAAYELAEYYYNGVGLLSSGKDRSKAFSFYEKAARKGHVDAMFKIGCGLYEGKNIPEDKIKGYDWLKKAESLGHEKAKEYLADRK